jgi:hypothetical protein
MSSYKIEYKNHKNDRWQLHSLCQDQYHALKAFNELNILVLDDNSNNVYVRVINKKDQVLISKHIQSFELYTI